MHIIILADALTTWTEVGSIATAVSMIALIATVILTGKSVKLSSKAIEDSMKSFTKSFEASHYTELDSMYCDLLKVALQKPYLVATPELRTAAQKPEYDIYAYMIWNFLEAIHDRCIDDDPLKSTWYPVIDAENRLHRDWFKEDRNKHKFKTKFYNFILNDEFKSHCSAA
jgi:hypothetical protein